MKTITLSFLTKKGEEAYQKVDFEGKSRPWRERKIGDLIAKDKVLSRNPLIVRIDIKMEVLAVQIEIDKNIISGLAKYGAELNKDYTMKIR